MDKLKEFALNLSAKEKKLVKYIFKLRGKDNTKLGILASYLISSKDPKDSEISSIIYGCAPDSKLSHLKRKLHIEFIKIFALNLDERSFTNSKLNKLRILASTTYSAAVNFVKKGNKDIAIHIIREAIKELTKNEMYEEILLLESFSFRVCGNLQSENELDSSYQRICNYSNFILNYYELDRDYKKVTYEKKEVEFDGSKVEFKESDVYRISSLKYRIRIFTFYKRKDYVNLDKEIDHFNLISKNQSFSKSELAGLKVLKANSLMFIGEFEKAIEIYEESLQLIVPNSQNSFEVKVNILRALFYLDRLEVINDLVNSTFNYEVKKKYLSLLSIFSIARSFKLVKFDDCFRLLIQDIPHISFDKNFRIWIKLWEILVLFELKNWDWLDNRLDSIRKMLGKKRETIYKREWIIFSLFKSLFVHGDISVVYLKRSTDLRLLLNSQGEYSWDPLGYELIPFHTWFQDKLKREKELESNKRRGNYRKSKLLKSN